MTGEQAAAQAITMIEQQIGADNLAAVIIEPIPGEGGFIVPAPGFLTALGTWCGENGVLLIPDEIQSGLWHRTVVRQRLGRPRAGPRHHGEGTGCRNGGATSNDVESCIETLDWSPRNGWAPTTSVDASRPRAV